MELTDQRLVGRDTIGKKIAKMEHKVEHAIAFSIYLAVFLWAFWTAYLDGLDDTEFSKGYYQVEITGVEASGSGFLGAQPDATSPQFNVTARVVNGHKNEQVTLQSWEADISYAGTPLGMGYFPEVCLEKMAEKTVTATMSNELVGFLHADDIRRRMASGESESGSEEGALQLQIDMRLRYTVYRRSGRQIDSLQWLWCNATLDAQSGPSHCRIYEYTEPPGCSPRMVFSKEHLATTYLT
ncbi:hypothetical protein ACP70R_037109 [Stipagrostis hirtigluma subsp. patula]